MYLSGCFVLLTFISTSSGSISEQKPLSGSIQETDLPLTQSENGTDVVKGANLDRFSDAYLVVGVEEIDKPPAKDDYALQAFKRLIRKKRRAVRFSWGKGKGKGGRKNKGGRGKGKGGSKNKGGRGKGKGGSKNKGGRGKGKGGGKNKGGRGKGRGRGKNKGGREKGKGKGGRGKGRKGW